LKISGLSMKKIEHDPVERLDGAVQKLERLALVCSLVQLVHGRWKGQPCDAPDQGGILDDQESHGDNRPDI
jgi:hypothetical protein